MVKGDLDGAIVDATRAIQLDSKSEPPYNIRALANLAKGDFEGAIADYTRLIELDPKNANFHRSRGIANYAMQRFDNALVDLLRSRELQPPHQHTPIFVFLTRSRLGERKPATDELREYFIALTSEPPFGIALGTSVDLDSWFKAVIVYLLGERSEQSLIERAERADNVEERRYQRCSANYLVGTMKLLAGDKAAAVHFRSAIETGAISHEFALSNAELTAISPRR